MNRSLFFAGLLFCTLLLFNRAKGQNQTVFNGQATNAITFGGPACVYSWGNNNPSIGLPITGTGNIPSFTATNPGTTPVKATITGYYTPQKQFAYIVNQLNNNISVYNITDAKIEYVVKTGSEPYGIAINPDGSKVYVANRTSGTVTVIKTAAKSPMATIPVGAKPEGVAISPDGSKVYAVSYEDATVTVINTADNSVIKTIANVGLHPSGVTVSADGTKVFVTETSSAKVFVINATTNTVATSINVGANPAGLALSPDGSKLYVANTGSNNVTVINAATNSVVTTVSAGTQPFGIAISPDGSLVYVSNKGSNDVTIINTADNTRKATVAVGTGPRGVSVTPDGKSIYVANFDSNNTTVINATTNAVSTLDFGYYQPFSFGNFTAGGGACSTTPVSIEITVNPTPPTITTNGVLSALTTSQGVPSASTSFNLSALSLTAGVFVTPPAGFEVSTDNITFTNTVTVGAAGNIASTPVYVRLSANAATGSYSGNITLSSPGASMVIMPTANSTVTAPVPAIATTKASGAISGCAGSPSISPYLQQFTVSGVNLGGILTTTAPAGFEVSIAENTGYATNITISNTANTGNIIVYVRSSGSQSGSISGNVQLSSPGATSKTVTVAGTVNTLPVINPVTDKIFNSGTATTVIKFIGTGNTYSWTNNTPSIGLAASGMGDIKSFMPVNNGTTPIVATITAVPLSAPLAYVTNFNANMVSAISTLTNAVVATFPVGSLPLSVVVSPDATRAYVANYNSGDVSVINTGTNTVIATIKVGTEPLSMAISADGSQLDVFNFYDLTVSQINTATNTVSSVTDVGKYTPETIFNRDGSVAYVMEYDHWTVRAVNTKTGETLKVFPVSSSYGGVAISPDGTRLYISNSNDNTIVIINTANNNTITTIPAGLDPRGISLNADGSRLYVVNSSTNSVSVYNTATLAAVVSNIPVDNFPLQVGNTTGTGCNGNAITFKITVMPQPPTITYSGTPADMTTTVGTASASTSFDVSGTKLTAGILVTAPPGYEVSDDDVTFSPTITIGGAGTVTGVPVYIRLAATTPVGSYPGNITLSSPGATDVLVPVAGTVTAAIPTLAISKVTGIIFSCAGTPSASPNIQQFKVSGSLLTSNVVVTAPPNFEVSLTAASGYGSSLTISPSGGLVGSTVIYVRSSITASGTIADLVNVHTNGGVDKTAPVNGVANPLPSMNTVTDPPPVTGGTATTAISFTGNANTFNWINDNPGIGLAASGSGDITSFIAINNTGATITANVTVTPLLAPFAYVASQNSIALVNTGNNKILATIPVGSVAYGVSASADGKWIYVSNQSSNTVSVISTTSNQKTDDIVVGSNPAGVVVSPDGKMLYVVNRNSNTLSVINIATKAITTVNVGISPLGLAISPDGKTVYVANQSSNSISIVNTTTLVVSSIAVGKSPEGLAITPDGSMLYVTNYNDKTVWAISTETYTPIAKITVNNNPRGIAISPDGGQVYIGNFGSNNVSVINTTTNAVIATIPVGTGPLGLSFTQDGSKVYVANYGSNNMSVVNTATRAVTTIAAGPAPISFGNFITGGSGCSGDLVHFKITVLPGASNITFTGTLPPLTTTYGTPSASASFNIAGVTMPSGILTTPPAGFEVSTNNTNFSSTVTVGAAGTIPPTPVYIRLAATSPVNPYSGNIVLSSSMGGTKDVPTAASIVKPATLTLRADDKFKILGEANPALTITYTGFVNSESAAILTKQAVVTTTATASSPIGQYPITVADAAAANYTLVYVAGVLTVNATPQAIIIPNTFTPNGDGINDTWEIKSLASFPGSTVYIYDRYGTTLYSSLNNSAVWDGKYRGTNVPSGTYYYIIDLKNKQKPLSGNLTVVR